MESSILWMILLQLILIGFNAIFACAEIAVISVNDTKLAKLAEDGDKRAIRLVSLTSQPARFLATIQVAITLSGFLGSAFAAENFSDGLVSWLLSLGVSIPASTLDAISVIVITLILSYVTLIFGELVPKRIAMRKAEPLALAMSKMITIIAKLCAPIVWFLSISTNAILRLLGIDPNEEEESVSEEEIRMMVDASSEKGAIDMEEKEFIQNVFEFDDITIGEIATHRTEITMLWLEDSMEDWHHTIQQSHHTMFPICDGSADHIVGILNAKQYLRLQEPTREQVMLKAVTPAYFVPESICADSLFKQMKQTHNHFAVVLDEYGGMSGIITMNDLLEQLVGSLEDHIPMEREEQALIQIDANTWKIKGSISLDEVAKQLHISLPLEDYDTFGGYIFGLYGFIPEDGTGFELDLEDIHIKVTEIKDHRMEQAIITMNKDISSEA